MAMNFGCVICAEPFSDKDEEAKVPVVTKCWHVFHESCIKKWFEKCKSCPECRTEFLHPTNFIHKIHLQNINNMDNSLLFNSLLEKVDLLNSKIAQMEEEIEIRKNQTAEMDVEIIKLRAGNLDLQKRVIENDLFVADGSEIMKVVRDMDQMCGKLKDIALKYKNKKPAVIDLSSSPQAVSNVQTKSSVRAGTKPSIVVPATRIARSTTTGRELYQNQDEL